MAARLRDEIRQRRPFASLEQEAYLNIMRTADALAAGIEEVLKPAGLTGTQYNVLRILRGAGRGGLACGEVGGRMLTHDPDITRMLDRLEKRGLVTRGREKRDRRVITTRITPAGLTLLKQLDRPVEDFHRKRLGHLGPRLLGRLVALLEIARESLR